MDLGYESEGWEWEDCEEGEEGEDWEYYQVLIHISVPTDTSTIYLVVLISCQFVTNSDGK